MQNKPVAVITGASSGIGYELAKQFAENGFDLIVAAENDGIRTAASNLEKLGCTVTPVQCDLTTPAGVETLWNAIAATGPAFDAIAINAGVGLGGKFSDNDLEAEIDMINLNVISSVMLAKYAVRYMLQRAQGGKILFTSSIAATMPGSYQAVYNATKAFVHSLSEALHYELKENGIAVTALMPGPTETNFFERAGMLDTKVGADEKDDPAQVAKMGFEALMKNKDHVIAGSLKTRIQNTANDLIPEQVKAKMHANMAKPGSGHLAKKKK